MEGRINNRNSGVTKLQCGDNPLTQITMLHVKPPRQLLQNFNNMIQIKNKADACQDKYQHLSSSFAHGPSTRTSRLVLFAKAAIMSVLYIYESDASTKIRKCQAANRWIFT